LYYVKIPYLNQKINKSYKILKSKIKNKINKIMNIYYLKFKPFNQLQLKLKFINVNAID